jgi:hypothetical protein
MSIEDLVARAESQSAGGVLNPLVVVRMGELQHRKASGRRPEVINLSPEFYGTFMKAYGHMKQMVRVNEPEMAETIDMERPHVLGIPIRLNPEAKTDIEYYVSPNAGRIIIP